MSFASAALSRLGINRARCLQAGRTRNKAGDERKEALCYSIKRKKNLLRQFWKPNSDYSVRKNRVHPVRSS